MPRHLALLILACSLCGSALADPSRAADERRPLVSPVLQSADGRFAVGRDAGSRLPRSLDALGRSGKARRGGPLSARARSGRFLREHRVFLFGSEDVAIDENAGTGRVSIRHERTRRTRGVEHLWQRQYIDGVPIFDAWIQTHVDASGGVLALDSRFMELDALPDTRPGIDAEAALAAALSAIDRPGAAQIEPTTELGLIEREAALRLVYRTRHTLYSPYGDWESLVDAHTGEVLSTTDRTIRCKGHGNERIDLTPPPGGVLPGLESEALRSPVGASAARGAPLLKATGTGYVLPANPLNGEPSRYDLRDGDNVDGFRESRAIERLDGSGFLRGDWADAYRNTLGTRTNNAVFQYFYSSSDSAGSFHEVNAYWHIDQFQEYVKNTLGVDGANDRRQVIYAHELHPDQSDYQPSIKIIRMGDGGVDDAEDGEIVLHEYGHAIHDDIIPGWSHTQQTGAMGEGFGDYLAATFGDNPLVGEWDATSYQAGPPPFLRRVDLPNVYPGDYTAGNIYHSSAIISGAWWDLREALGAQVADAIIISAFHYMPFNPDFQDAVDGAIRADRATFGGSHVDTIYHTFADRGLFPKAVATLASNLAATMEGNHIVLSWELLVETGVSGIQVERRIDDGEYGTLLDEHLVPEAGRMTAIDEASDVLAGQLLSYRLVARFDDGGEQVVGGVETSLRFVPMLPSRVLLEQNFPNPFNPSTTIRFTLPRAGATSLRVYDRAGRLVRTLVAETLEAREHEFVWDGRDQSGATVSSGLYTYRLTSRGQHDSRNMVLIK